jgi:hypothetical protein
MRTRRGNRQPHREDDPIRGRLAGTARNVELDPTRPVARRKTVTQGEEG